jgi:SHAQKYF class myb-like DNA-binding protein
MHPVSPLQEQQLPVQAQNQRPGSTKVGRWTEEEHGVFCKGMREFPKQWKTIAAMVKTRTVVQIRTHAQKCWNEGLPDGGQGMGDLLASSAGASPRPKKRKAPKEERPAALFTPPRKENPLNSLNLSMPVDSMLKYSNAGLEGSPTSVATNGFNIFNEPLRSPMTPQNTATRLSFSLENSPDAYKGANVISASQPYSTSLNSVDPLLLQKARLTESEIVSLMNDDFSSAEHELLLSIPDVFE